MKWNKLKEVQPNVGEKIIYRVFNTKSIYPIKYGTYLGTERNYFYLFQLWFDGDLCLEEMYLDIIWIPYPENDELELEE